jgi:hypothetical protein
MSGRFGVEHKMNLSKAYRLIVSKEAHKDDRQPLAGIVLGVLLAAPLWALMIAGITLALR